MSAKVLVIGAHNDDPECGVGGTTALLTKAGCDAMFFAVAPMWHKPDLTPEMKEEWARQEVRAANILGADYRVIGTRDGDLRDPNTELVKELSAAIVDYAPNIVFIHWPKDFHIEHQMAAAMSYKALCLAHVNRCVFNEVYAFEASIHQTGRFFNPEILVNIGDVRKQLEESILCFDQNTARGAGVWNCHIKQAECLATEIGWQAAEAFRVVKFPNGSDDFLLRRLLGDRFRWAGNGMYPAGAEPYFGL